MSPEAFEHNANIQFKRKLFPQADGCFQSAFNLTEDPAKRTEFLFMRGLCYMKMIYFSNPDHHKAQAIKVFKQAIGLNGSPKFVYLSHAFLRILKTSSLEISSMLFKDVVDPRIPDEKTLAPCAVGCVWSTDPSLKTEAIRALEKVIAIDADCILAHEYLSDLVDDISQKIAALREVTRINPGHEKAWELMGIYIQKKQESLYGEGSYKELGADAWDAYLHALELNPANDCARCNLQWLYGKTQFIGSYADNFVKRLRRIDEPGFANLLILSIEGTPAEYLARALHE